MIFLFNKWFKIYLFPGDSVLVVWQEERTPTRAHLQRVTRIAAATRLRWRARAQRPPLAPPLDRDHATVRRAAASAGEVSQCNVSRWPVLSCFTDSSTLCGRGHNILFNLSTLFFSTAWPNLSSSSSIWTMFGWSLIFASRLSRNFR